MVNVLKEKPSLLTRQVQAAEIYQDQGSVAPSGYVKAIMGGAPGKDGRNLIWGWAKISQLTMRDSKFDEMFHNARLNIAEARYGYALTRKDSKARKKVLQDGVEDLWSVYKQRPDLGGPETRASTTAPEETAKGVGTERNRAAGIQGPRRPKRRGNEMNAYSSQRFFVSRPYVWPAIAVLATLLAPAALAVDRVRLVQGSQQSGTISATTATQVTLEIGATRREIPVNEIDTVQFDAEPTQLTQARAAVKTGRYQDAAANLAKIAPAQMTRAELAKDVEFYKALVAARLALAGTGSIADAGKRMLTFEKANPTSFHYLEACETLGDLLVALGNYPIAETYYGKLASAPWPEYKMRAAVRTGRALVAQKKYADAIARFDPVINAQTTGDAARAEKTAAALGKAEALSGAGETEQAVKLVDEVIAKTDADNDDLFARAYNIQGNCYRAAGKVKPAIVAFLHVDLLYPQFPEQHAEALANLAQLFTQANKPQRAAQARGTLMEKYPSSTWAKQ